MEKRDLTTREQEQFFRLLDASMQVVEERALNAKDLESVYRLSYQQTALYIVTNIRVNYIEMNRHPFDICFYIDYLPKVEYYHTSSTPVQVDKRMKGGYLYAYEDAHEWLQPVVDFYLETTQQKLVNRDRLIQDAYERIISLPFINIRDGDPIERDEQEQVKAILVDLIQQAETPAPTIPEKMEHGIERTANELVRIMPLEMEASSEDMADIREVLRGFARYVLLKDKEEKR
jgi:hypothetical protein